MRINGTPVVAATPPAVIAKLSAALSASLNSAASVRAFNRNAAATTAGLRDRLCPVAMIPMHTPEEAVAELEHCVRELGFRAVLLAGHVARPSPIPNPPRTARWIDTLGLDSLYDYDPVWAKCEELKLKARDAVLQIQG